MPRRSRWLDPQRGHGYMRFPGGDLKDVTSEVSSGSESVGQPTESSENPGRAALGHLNNSRTWVPREEQSQT